jgi:hypothetical protein
VDSSSGRNAPCPCGSGKKFKKCHGAREAALWQSPWLWGILVTALCLGGLAYLVKDSPARQGASAPIQQGSSQAPQRTGAPWEYDAASNMHFDPSAGHNHWHPGPPPAGKGKP